MKIVFANNYHYMRGGSERVYFNEQHWLTQAGHQVAAFSRRHCDNLAAEHADLFPPAVDFQQLGGVGKITGAARLMHSRRAGKAFSKMLDRTRPDVVHAHNIYGGLTTSILAAAKGRQPIVMTLHDYKLICPSYLMLARNKPCKACVNGGVWHCVWNRCHKSSLIASALYTAETCFNRWLGRYDAVDRFICPSRFLLELHAQAGIDRRRLVYLPNAIPLERFAPAWGGQYILYVGRLSKEKGVATLIEAAGRAGAPLHIVGTGPIEPELRTLAASCKANVTFRGHLAGAELAEAFRNALAVVVPSEWYENCPMSVLESFAYGKAVIGARIGGIPEFVIHRRTGLLFDPGDAEALEACISDLWEREDRAIAIGRRARALVEEQLDARSHVESLLQIYREVKK